MAPLSHDGVPNASTQPPLGKAYGQLLAAFLLGNAKLAPWHGPVALASVSHPWLQRGGLLSAARLVSKMARAKLYSYYYYYYYSYH